MPDEIFFINKGIIRVLITDNEGTEHTIHFAMENQFIADYSHFIQRQPSIYSLTNNGRNRGCYIACMLEWVTNHLKEGQKWAGLSQILFIYQDDRIKIRMSEHRNSVMII
ncbi:MAG: hypothetical protein IPL20_11020 [Saprospiraceae bacterium]|nr:hypothetical protein [Saprospiraceae bacterium]